MRRERAVGTAAAQVRNVRVAWALAATLCLIGFAGKSADSPTPVVAGAVYSTAQQSSQSFLRFHNTGTSAGTVTVTLRDQASGQSLGQWTSPSIAMGAEQQYAIGTLESSLGQNFVKPSYYSISIQTGLAGYFQHVLYRPADGTLTNLSTCARGTTADPIRLSGVHSSQLASHPSSIVVNNTGALAMSPTLGIYDARDGTRLGTYTGAAVAAGGQAVLTVSAIEAAAGVTPAAGMFHYVVGAEGTFTGFLQHLVDNTQAGVITDMTTVCTLDGSSSAAAGSPTRSGAVFSTAQSGSQSFLRFYNTGGSAGTVTVTLNDPASGQALGAWTSPSIPSGSEKQFPISTVESETGQAFAKPDYYTIKVQSDLTGYFQHVLYRPADGTLTNLSTCSAGVTANRTKLSGVHSSLLGNGYLSTVIVNNTGASAASVTLGIYDAQDGTRHGTYTTASIPPNGQALISVATIETAVGAPTPGLFHYVIRAEGSFTGFLQHLVDNVQAGVITDMTTACALAVQPPTASAQTYVENVSNPRFGRTCQPGQTSMDGYLLVCSSAGKYRYALAEDIPARPAGGYVARPAWYPPLTEMFSANNPPSCPASGRVTLTNMIVPVDQLSTTTSQGAMIGEHVTPIDHGYVGIKSLDKPLAERTEADYVPVYAPANAEIIEISLLGSPTSIRLIMAHGCETYTVIMVLNRLSGVLAGYQAELQSQGRVTTHINVLAGQKIGEQRDNPLDFAVNDSAVWLPGYVAPFSYAAGEAWKPYTSADPLSYFTPDLATALESNFRRLAPPRWGQIDQDIAGTAAGNWFLDGTVGYSGRSTDVFRTATQRLTGGPFAGKNTPAWSHLAIARHWDLPTYWVFSTGWWQDESGDAVQKLMEIPSGTPEPSQLTADHGVVVYALSQVPNAVGGAFMGVPSIQGIVAIQVNEDETLTIEPFPTAQNLASFTGFTAAKRTYRR